MSAPAPMPGRSGDTATNPGATPPAATGWDSLADPSSGDVPSAPDDGPLIVGLVNQDKDLEGKAAFLGENRLAEDLESKKRPLLRRIMVRAWKGGWARNYYRQKYINEARRDLLAGQTLAVEQVDNERRHYNRDVANAFIDETEGVIDEASGDVRKSLKTENPALYDEISNIVKRYASGDIANSSEAEELFNDAIANFRDGELAFGADNLKASNITQVAIAARQRFENMMTVSEAAKGRFDHDAAMARVMSGFDVLYGQRQIDRIRPNFNKVDQIVAKAQKSNLGRFVNSEVIALAVGVAASVSEACTKRIPGRILSVVPGLGAGVLGGIKAGTDFERDRARAEFDMRYDRKYDGNQKRREKINRTLHKFEKADDVRNDLGNRIAAIREAQARGEDTSAMQTELLTATAHCKALLSMERTKDCAISYSSEQDAPYEQILLLRQMAEAKQFLRDSGVADIDDRLRTDSDIMVNAIGELSGNVADAKSRAHKQKARDIAGRAAKNFGTGLLFSLGAEELKAVFNDDVQGIFESHNPGAKNATSIRKVFDLFSPKRTEPDVAFLANYDVAKGIINDNSGEFSFEKAKDGTFTLLREGKPVASNLDWNAKTGFLTEDSINSLRSQGINVEFTGDKVAQSITKNITTTETYTGKYSDDPLKFGGTKISRERWMDNDTPRIYDFNEKGLCAYTSPDGQHGAFAAMTDSGSRHAGHTVSFSSEAKAGRIKLALYPTSDCKTTPILVDMTGYTSGGYPKFVPEEGSMAAQLFDEKGNFRAWHTEVVHVLGEKNGVTNIETLATYTTRKGAIDPEGIFTRDVTTQVTEDLQIPQFQLSTMKEAAEQAWKVPVLLPFTSGRAMNASEATDRTKNAGYDPYRGGYGYGYGGYGGGEGYYGGYNAGEINPDEPYNATSGASASPDTYTGPRTYTTGDVEYTYSQNVERFSPSLDRGKELNLGNEVSRYTYLMRQERGDAYADSIERKLDSSPELKSIDNTTKTIVTIPVHAIADHDNIYKSISTYAAQQDVDFDSVLFVIDINWRKEEKVDSATLDADLRHAREELERARRDFPNLKIASLEHPGHGGIHEVSGVMNDTIMAAIDHSVKDGRMNSANDVLIIRNDVDLKHIDKRYLASYQEAAKKNPKTPLFTGTTWFNIDRTRRAPGLGAVLMIERFNNLFHATEGGIHTAGGNFGYRASAFAAANGYGFRESSWKGAGSDDLQLGYRIEEAFSSAYNSRMDNSGNPDDHNLMDPQSRMLVRVGQGVIDTDDARYLKYYASPDESVTDDAYGNSGYNSNPLRPGDIKDFREDINNRASFNATVEQFEREMSQYFTHHEHATNPRFLRRIINWFLDYDPNDLNSPEYYTITRISRPNGRLTGGSAQFKLTPEGRERYRQALIKRMGTGYSANDRNTLQRAVTNGDLITPRAA